MWCEWRLSVDEHEGTPTGLVHPDTRSKTTGWPRPGPNRRDDPGCSSSARCSTCVRPVTPARSSSWVRQEKPSARTTASAPGIPYGGQQVVLGDRHRDLVVALLDPEVAGQPAAAAHPGDRRPGARQQCRVGLPAEHRVVVAVRLGDHLDAGEVGRRPVPGGRARRAARRASARRRRPRRPAGRRPAGRRPRAGRPGSSAPARPPACRARRTGAASSTARATIRRAAVELPGGDPGEPAAGRLRDHRRAQPDRLEQRDRRPAGLGGEPVGEGVGPEPHVHVGREGRLGSARPARVGPARAQRLGGEARQAPALVDARGRLREPGRAAGPAQSGVRQPRAASSAPTAAAGRARSGSAGRSLPAYRW